jgi:predicted Zn finger-like uncharacterized protein
MGSGVNEKSLPAMEVPAPHVVITCPSCNTSFAVETAAVAALETPRFHCSRCDDVFIMRDDPRASGFNLQSLSRRSAKIDAVPAHNSEPKRSGSHDPLLKSTDFSLTAPGSREMQHFEREVSPQGSPSPRSEGWDAVGAETKASSAHLTDGSSPRFTLLDQELEEPPIHNPKTQESQTPRRFVLSDSEAPPTTTTRRTEDVRARGSKSEPRTIQPLRRPDTKALDATEIPGRLSARTQSLVSMSTPVLSALLLILALSYSARLSPESMDAIANLAIPSFAKGVVQELPPQNLSARGLTLSFQKTRNRETVAVVKGAILNETGSSFEGVEVEALGFSERGEVILSSRAPLRSALANQKVSQLSIGEISEIQTQENGEHDSIIPREAVPFSIALLDAKQHEGQDGNGGENVDPSQIRYFSARVFSVRQRN